MHVRRLKTAIARLRGRKSVICWTNVALFLCAPMTGTAPREVRAEHCVPLRL